MKKQLFVLPSVVFFLIISVFLYLLLIERNPSELPSVLINKKAPNFKTTSLFDENLIVSNKDVVLKLGAFLLINTDGSSDGFLSINNK
jgi:hypothetical protein